jgi:DNA modification methylase
VGDCPGLLDGCVSRATSDNEQSVKFLRGAPPRGLTEILIECRRVLKPGAFALLWAIPRTSHWTATALEDAGFEIRDVISHVFGTGFPHGNNLKPASEHWILVRNPLRAPNVSQNLDQYGTGALNIDLCRVNERYPANFLLSIDQDQHYARYFYCPKPSKEEKTQGLDNLPLVPSVSVNDRIEKRQTLTRNPHPTVKPVKLMRYLCRLITPPGGTILDPFCGSGTTGVAGVAALLEGFPFLGIEREREYFEVALARLARTHQHPAPGGADSRTPTEASRRPARTGDVAAGSADLGGVARSWPNAQKGAAPVVPG